MQYCDDSTRKSCADYAQLSREPRTRTLYINKTKQDKTKHKTFFLLKEKRKFCFRKNQLKRRKSWEIKEVFVDMIKNRSLLRSIEKDHLETFAALTKRREIEKPVCWRRPVFASQRPVPTSSGTRPVHRKDQRSDPEQEHFRMTNWVGSYNLMSCY